MKKKNRQKFLLTESLGNLSDLLKDKSNIKLYILCDFLVSLFLLFVLSIFSLLCTISRIYSIYNCIFPVPCFPVKKINPFSVKIFIVMQLIL